MSDKTSLQTSRILLSLTGMAPEAWLAELKHAAPDREITLAPDGAEDPSIRYAIVWKQPKNILSRLPSLEIIFSVGAGVDHVFRDETIPDAPIVRVVSPDLTMRMSEYVVWQVLDHHRRGPAYRDQQQRKIWREHGDQPAAGDVTVGIIGLGQLGMDAARKLATLGFKVVGWSRTPKPEAKGIENLHGPEGLDALAGRADILVCLLPLTPQTRGILAAPLFAKLKRGGPFGAPVLINAGRGLLQNESDILAALESGRLSAASLDVFHDEPLPEESPFWHHPRVFVTPHAAASSSAPHLVPPIVEQMIAHEEGRPLTNLVDRARQY